LRGSHFKGEGKTVTVEAKSRLAWGSRIIQNMLGAAMGGAGGLVRLSLEQPEGIGEWLPGGTGVEWSG
jgi:hypothetical protein